MKREESGLLAAANRRDQTGTRERQEPGGCGGHGDPGDEVVCAERGVDFRVVRGGRRDVE